MPTLNVPMTHEEAQEVMNSLQVTLAEERAAMARAAAAGMISALPMHRRSIRIIESLQERLSELFPEEEQ